VSPSFHKVAIVTGASRGIGAGLVDAFRAAGYAVVGTALSIRPSDEVLLLTVEGDIAEAETAERVAEQTLERFGRIDTLINNAGIYIGKPFTDCTADDYAAITAVNLAGFFHITQRAIRQMVARGSGHVVNISTSLVDRADSQRPSALPALTKGGLAAVVRSLAIEYAARGVRVNAVALGVIKTPGHDPAAYEGLAAFIHSAGWARSPTSSTGSSISSGPRSSPARSCTSTAGRPLDADIQARSATRHDLHGSITDPLAVRRRRLLV
jgi:NAD(P)-dependent dehydrogenase (short-subunit alcohol dehydrogenase family)